MVFRLDESNPVSTLSSISVSAFSARNCDFELKNGSGFCFQGFIAGERFETMEVIDQRSPWDILMNSKDDKRSAGIQPPAIGGKMATTS